MPPSSAIGTGCPRACRRPKAGGAACACGAPAPREATAAALAVEGVFWAIGHTPNAEMRGDAQGYLSAHGITGCAASMEAEDWLRAAGRLAPAPVAAH